MRTAGAAAVVGPIVTCATLFVRGGRLSLGLQDKSFQLLLLMLLPWALLGVAAFVGRRWAWAPSRSAVALLALALVSFSVAFWPSIDPYGLVTATLVPGLQSLIAVAAIVRAMRGASGPEPSSR